MRGAVKGILSGRKKPVSLFKKKPEVFETSSGWSPPAEWGWDAASALVGDSDNGFVALVAVYEHVPTFWAFKLFLYSTGGVIDWGDGSSSGTLAHNTLIEHEFNYSGISSSVTSFGYKIAIVKITTTSNLNGFYHGQFTTAYGLQYYTKQPLLALKIRSQDSKLYYSGLYNGIEMTGLELLDLGAVELSEINTSYSFIGFWKHSSLKKLITGGWQSVGNWGYLTYGQCDISGFDINTVNDWSKCERLYQTFNGTISSGGNRIFSQAIDNADSLFGAFSGSRCFEVVNLTNTGNVTNIASACVYSGIKEFTMDDCASITDTTAFVATTSGYGHLFKLILSGLTVGINISNHKLDATALNAFQTALGTANGAQTLTFTGNPGAATCDTSIGTAKGYTVVIA